MLVDHLIFAAPDLDTAVADIETRLGVRAGGGGQHVGQGTHNRLIALGPSTYLELIAPDPRQPDPASPRPYGVDGVTRPSLVGWAIPCDDIEHAIATARAAGFDPGGPIEGQRLTPAGTWLRWRNTGNARTAGVIPFLIDWGDTPHPASSMPAGPTIAALHIEHPEPPMILNALHSMGVDIEVRPGLKPALVAGIDTLGGVVELR